MSTNDKLAHALRELANKFSEGWHDGLMIDASDIVLLSDAADALAAHEAEKAAPAWECKAGGLKPLTDEQYRRQPASIQRHYTRIAAPVAVPLTDEEKLKMWQDFDHPWGFGKYEWYLQGIEDAERTLAKRWGVKLEGGE